MNHVTHPIPPVWDERCTTLILGSFPSVKSRENGFFYGHPQNRFWRMLAQVYDEPVPLRTEDKQALLLRRHLALWDVIASCEVTGSSDASIRDVVPVDVALITGRAPIRRVLCNGALAGKLYRQHLQPVTGLPAIVLPSTSPANAAWTLDRLAAAWACALPKEPTD